MKILLHPSFKKAYKKRIANSQKLINKTAERIELFRQDRQNEALKDHPLKGTKKAYRSFSVTGDVRIVYILKDGNNAVFVDIGSHNQVY